MRWGWVTSAEGQATSLNFIWAPRFSSACWRQRSSSWRLLPSPPPCPPLPPLVCCRSSICWNFWRWENVFQLGRLRIYWDWARKRSSTWLRSCLRYFWFSFRPREVEWRHAAWRLLLLDFTCFSGRCRPAPVHCWSCLRISRCTSFGGFRPPPSLNFFTKIISWNRKESTLITWRKAHCPSFLVSSWSSWCYLTFASSFRWASSSFSWSLSPCCWAIAWAFRSYRRLAILFPSCWTTSPLVFTFLATSPFRLLSLFMRSLRRLQICALSLSSGRWKHRDYSSAFG